MEENHRVIFDLSTLCLIIKKSSILPSENTVKMQQRGKSVEPGELNKNKSNYVTRRQMRARSAGPISMANRASRLLQNQYGQAVGTDQRGSSLPRQPADRALINQHVNPYQEFPSLRRGFTLEGRAILVNWSVSKINSTNNKAEHAV